MMFRTAALTLVFLVAVPVPLDADAQRPDRVQAVIAQSGQPHGSVREAPHVSSADIPSTPVASSPSPAPGDRSSEEEDGNTLPLWAWAALVTAVLAGVGGAAYVLRRLSTGTRT